VNRAGYVHEVTIRKRTAFELMPRVHRVVALLKRWLLGTHPGAVSPAHLDYYLDEFTFRFNRRTSRSRGKLFYRLLQQAVAVEPTPTQGWSSTPEGKSPGNTRCSGNLSQVDTPISKFEIEPSAARCQLDSGILPAASCPLPASLWQSARCQLPAASWLEGWR
jgi:hypothetical protein